MNKSRLSVAEAVGEDLVRLLTPYCARIEIAGSIRRQRPQVKDIELLCVSKVTSSPDMFGEVATNHYALDLKLDELVADGSVLKKRPNKAGRYSYGKQNKLLVHVETGISVDVFSTDAENWGMALLVRTGSREFNIRVMQRFIELGMRGHAYGGVTDQEGSDLDCLDEEAVLRLLGWPWIPPWERNQ